MPNIAVPMPGGGTRRITEEERARIARKYGSPQHWKDPHPRPGIWTTFDSYVPTPDEVRELDREAERRADEAHAAVLRDKRARERATHHLRRFLPRQSEAVARGIEQALLHRAGR